MRKIYFDLLVFFSQMKHSSFLLYLCKEVSMPRQRRYGMNLLFATVNQCQHFLYQQLRWGIYATPKGCGRSWVTIVQSVLSGGLLLDGHMIVSFAKRFMLTATIFELIFLPLPYFFFFPSYFQILIVKCQREDPLWLTCYV